MDDLIGNNRRRSLISIQVRNRLRPTESVGGAVVQLSRQGLAQPVIATTSPAGLAALSTADLADGAHTLTVTAVHTSGEAVGPGIATGPTPHRIFRSLLIQVTLTSGRVVAAAAALASTANGTVALMANQSLVVHLQPVWMRSPNHAARNHDVSGIIIHHTGAPTIGGALEEFLNNQTSAHYIIDTDGQIVKIVQDIQRANHAGVARWNGDAHVNARTIGIEIVNITGAYR